MDKLMSACGVLCSDCPACLGEPKGLAHQKRTQAAWRRIYHLNEAAENISCAGCLAPDDQVFRTCRKCEARLCCRSKGFRSCAECPEKSCAKLEKAQSVWDKVPELVKILSHEDFVSYVLPYCGHRKRLADARRSSASQRKHFR